jgi:hypothetical protein
MLRHLIIIFLISLSFNSLAESRDVESLVYDAAEEYRIDGDILLSIVTHESGNPKDHWAINPWALNIGGYSYYPKSKQDAYKLLINAILNGHETFGIGPGQIEWKYHRSSFDNIWGALNVKDNVFKAASYYKEMLAICDGDKWCAVGAYHTQNKAKSVEYIKMVKQQWSTISKASYLTSLR